MTTPRTKSSSTVASTFGALALLALALPANANDISSASPTVVEAGSGSVTVTFTIDSSVFPPPPPAGIAPTSVTLGTLEGGSIQHASQFVVEASFSVPSDTAPGFPGATIVFSTPQGTLSYTGDGLVEVVAASGPPAASFAFTPGSGVAPLSVAFTDASTGVVGSHAWSFGDGGSSSDANPVHVFTAPGVYSVSLTVTGPEGSDSTTQADAITVIDPDILVGTYPVVDTGQTACFDNNGEIVPPASGAAFYGQDGQHAGNAPSFTLSADGLTVADEVTGLTWVRDPDTDGDGDIDADDKILLGDADAYVAQLNADNFGGYNDWRLPSIKELYSLVDFRGTDPSGYTGTDTSGITPYIDTAYFDFGFGDTAAGERLIDAQYLSSTEYVSTTMDGNATVFGFNFADGRIKGYPQSKAMYVRCVRGNPLYGLNHYSDNGNGTIRDEATGLMWMQADSGTGMDWQEALAWAQARNDENYLGFDDWRLPDAKELQTLFDYDNAPRHNGQPAIDAVFSCTSISGEDGSLDYPFYWTGTTHVTWTGSGGWGVYLCFGTAYGYWNSVWQDVHGAGAQRSDPKHDDGTDYSAGHGPQGDAVRIDNFVRLVRTMLPTDDSVGDGIPDAWRREHFGGTGTTVDSDSEATADPDKDGLSNYDEYVADTDPNDGGSSFSSEGAMNASGFSVSYESSAERLYTLWRSADLSAGSWQTVATQINIPGTGGAASLIDSDPLTPAGFYRVEVKLP
ncbi:DUF1566 domain-containing protein [Haloferula sp. A504]|uniref:Lcl domain-containing protein n=1 Tax=Haloferula sp. A504 TaxID=3373601 RepID=UPI0031C8DFBE|nr:DUF1566 domain-containing protein [Verrucomicrobiaceae bacterium E54]